MNSMADESNTRSKLKQMEDLNQDLKLQLEDARRQLAARSVSGVPALSTGPVPAAITDDVLLLKHQLQVYKEDFENERRDRELAQSRLSIVEAELEHARLQLHQHDIQLMESLQQRRVASLDFYKREYERSHPGVTCTDASDHDGHDEID